MILNRFKSGSRILAAAAVAACVAVDARSQALPSVQGVLRSEAGQPVSGSKVLRFSLYASPTGGTPLQEIRQTVDVSQGVFSASPGFDPQLFGAAEERWLEFGVQTGPGVFDTLTPRQRIGATPLALTIPGLQVTSNLVLDQEVPFSGTFGTVTLNDGIRWQSFTTGSVGEVRAVEASLQNSGGSASTVTATLYRGLGADGIPVAVTTASIPGLTSMALRFTFPAAVTAAAEEVFTIQLSSPGPVTWFVLRNSDYSRGVSNFEPNADFWIATYLSNRAAGSEFSFNGSVTASTVRGTYAFFNQLVQALTLSAVNANITDTVTANTISADRVNANSFNVPTLTSSFFVGQSMSLTTNAGIGLTNPSPDVRLEISKQSVGSGWHLYLSNFGAPTQFNRTGMRVSDVGFFEISPAINSGQFARLSGAGNWTAVSDARLKTDISPAEGLLDAALKLRPVNFSWISDGKRDTGLIAQEVKEVLPGFVVGDEKKDMLTVDYSHLSVVAIGALQEMHRELKAENEALRAELLKQAVRRTEDASAKQREFDALKKRLELLESMVISKTTSNK
ncbi:MAG: tail fiber domain-containing protein [Phycisphaerales bacterium]|nr:tail fiber domain-containing protein [Phycisphaerales bacterium]